MPLYVYVCRACDGRFEQLRSFAERLEPAECPECHAEARFALSLSAPALVGAAAAQQCNPENIPAGGGCCGGGACGAN